MTAPDVLDLPVGLTATGTRRETDAMGATEVPAGHYWGAQTQRSLEHFAIGTDRMPLEVARAYAEVKRAAAVVNGRSGRMPQWKADLVARVCDEVLAGELDDEFPLFVYQTGSGTQSNMNVNEVISNRCLQLVGAQLGSKDPVHPNDDVNMGQSSNDTFPTAMHLAVVTALTEQLFPSVQALHDAIAEKAEQWADVVKIGRTHLEDAVPLTVGQEWSGWASQLQAALDRSRASLPALHELAIGGTAVGTGLNAPAGFGQAVAQELSDRTGQPYTQAENLFAALAGLDAVVHASAGLRGLAVVLLKIANDVRWLASGPRSGLGELELPANEPGSSIMPGKVNPTQSEAMVMVCVQVIGDDGVVATAGSMGSFELNTMRPVVINDVLRSVRLLTDACRTFRTYCIEGTRLREDQIAQHLERSLMLVTALAPIVGYDAASAIAHDAHEHGTTLREAALATGLVDEETFDRVVDARTMLGS